MAGSSGKLPARRPRSLTPQKGSDTRTPLPPTAVRAPVARLPNDKPRVCFLHWSGFNTLAESYCADLFLFFETLATRGEIELVTMGESWETKAPRYPSIDQLKAKHIDALISNGIWRVDYLSELSRLNIPVVSCDHDAVGLPIDTVIFDGIKGGELGGKLFIQNGHTDILFISRLRHDYGATPGADPIIEDPTYTERRTGIQQALVGTNAEFWPLMLLQNKAGTDANVVVRESFERVVAEMGHWPTGIVTPDIGVARVTRKVMEDMGLYVPQHVSLLTFDARPRKDLEVPPEDRDISNLQYSWREMAENAWRMIRAHLAGVKAPPKRVALVPSYVDYGTLGPRREGP